jgi:hypothetical protein
MTRLRYSGMLRRVFWYMGTNIWEEQTAYFLRVYMIKLGKWLLIRKTERTWVTEGRSWRSEPTVAGQGQQRLIRANSGRSEPTAADQSQQRPIRPNNGRWGPTAVDQSQQRPMRANGTRSGSTAADQSQQRPTRANSGRPEPTAADQGQQYPIRANSGSAEGSCLSAVSTHANNNPSYRVLFITLQRKEGGLYLAHWTPLIHSKCCRRTKDVEWCFENFSALNVVHKRQRRSI